MENVGSRNKTMEWITLALAVLFLVIGVCILAGLFFPDKIFHSGSLRIVMGLLLIVYGTFRGAMIIRRLLS